MLKRFIDFGERITAQNAEDGASIRYERGQGIEGYQRYIEEKQKKTMETLIENLKNSLTPFVNTAVGAMAEAFKSLALALAVSASIINKTETSHRKGVEDARKYLSGDAIRVGYRHRRRE